MVGRLFLELPDATLRFPAPAILAFCWDSLHWPFLYRNDEDPRGPYEWWESYVIKEIGCSTPCIGRARSLLGRALYQDALVHMDSVVLDAFNSDKRQADVLYEELFQMGQAQPDPKHLDRLSMLLFPLLRKLLAFRERHMFLIRAPSRLNVSLCVSAPWKDLRLYLSDIKIKGHTPSIGRYTFEAIHYHLDSLSDSVWGGRGASEGSSQFEVADNAIRHYLYTTRHLDRPVSHVVRLCANRSGRGHNPILSRGTSLTTFQGWALAHAIGRLSMGAPAAATSERIHILGVPPIRIEWSADLEEMPSSSTGRVTLMDSKDVPDHDWDRWRNIGDGDPVLAHIQLLLPRDDERCPACCDPLQTPVPVAAELRNDLQRIIDSCNAQ